MTFPGFSEPCWLASGNRQGDRVGLLTRLGWGFRAGLAC